MLPLTKRRLVVAFAVIALFVGLIPLAMAVSAQGASVLTGRVTLDGQPASSGTLVRALDEGGVVIGETRTGRDGLAPDQYRLDVSLESSSPRIGFNTEPPGAHVHGNVVAATRRGNRSSRPQYRSYARHCGHSAAKRAA